MRPLLQKLAVATASATLAGVCAWVALDWRERTREPTVELLDNTLGISEVLLERALEAPEEAALPLASAGSEPPSYPPPLVREELTEEQAMILYGALRKPGQVHFQEQAHLWNRGDLGGARTFEEHAAGGWDFHTNRMGFRKDVEVLEVAPDVRVLVTGDSHTAGMVPNEESFSNVLEDLLRADDPTRTFEVLNGGVGGTSMYHYLGVLEFLEEQLRPQVLVVGFYGGNDFQGVMMLDRYYHRRPPPRFGPRGGSALRALPARGAVGQILSQPAYFLDNPADLQLAREAVDTLTLELDRRCRAADIDLVFVYIPPASSVQSERYAELLAAPLAALDMTPAHLALTDELAAHWLGFLEERGLTYIDMQPAFRASPKDCYWFADLHINTHAHRLIAEALAPVIASLGR